MTQPPPLNAGESAANSAAGDVGVQIYSVTGNVNYFAVSDTQQPMDKYKVAVRFLKARVTSEALRLIKDVVGTGFRGGSDDEDTGEISANHIAFHWLLAVLSESERITDDLLHAMTEARAFADVAADDEWLAGCRAIEDLVSCVRRQDEEDQAGLIDTGFVQFMRHYEALSSGCQEGIQRHLEPLLIGGQAVEVEALIANDAMTRRQQEQEERLKNAWKFFEPTPEPPRESKPDPPDFLTGQRVVAYFGAALGLAALACWVTLLQERGVLIAIIVCVVILAGAELAVWSAIAFAATRGRLAAKEREHGRADVGGSSRYNLPEPGTSPAHADDPDEAETDEEARGLARRKQFLRIATDHLNAEFRKHAPRAATARRNWQRDIAGLKKSLKDEILRVYHEPTLRHGSLNWLITYRVAEIASQWHDKTLRDYQTRLQPRVRTILGLGVGLVATLAAAIYAVIMSLIVWPLAGAAATLAMIVAGLLVGASRLDLFLVHQRAIRDGEPERTKRFNAEQAEHKRLTDELRDRPSDADVARWLDYDKIYLKTHALDQLGLARRDILSSATLVEPAPGRNVGIREPFGPPRYSKYLISVFLLTDSGVRQVQATVDTCTGDVYDQVRRSFRHDVIASAMVAETGIRFETGRREAMPPEGKRASRRLHPSGAVPYDRVRGFDASLILRQEIRLRLMSAETILLQVQSFDADFSDPAMENPTYLLNIALDTSGISSVMELLEAISGHGAQWAAQRERQRRRSRASTSEDKEEPGLGPAVVRDNTAGATPLRPTPSPDSKSDRHEVA
jgi:hypothetical protein